MIERRDWVRAVRDYIPRGNTLDAETFRYRHLLLCWILAGHIPSLFVFGVWRGYGMQHSALEIMPAVACLLLAVVATHRRLASFFSTAGLVYCSSTLVHLSEGSIEAHFHFFILIGLIALYQDWVPFGWNVMFTVISHGVGGVLDPSSMYNHAAAQNDPWTWAVIHGVSVLAACMGTTIFWKNTELADQRNVALATQLAQAQAEAAQRQSVSDLFVNLARRNQSLLDRQLELIGELEELKRTPEALSELFQLDHLATRIRRNAESLLVLSGDESPRRWSEPVPLSEVVRAAAAEVEDYRRVDVLVNDHLEVLGSAVADMAHLLAELIENATRFSPSTSEVRVRSYLAPGPTSSIVLSVEDNGIGMTDSDMRRANELVAHPPEVDLRGRTLGFHVVGRLARRYHLTVTLAHTPGGGVTALVTLPAQLVSERTTPLQLAPPSDLTTTPPAPFNSPPTTPDFESTPERELPPLPGPHIAPGPMPAPPPAPRHEPVPLAEEQPQPQPQAHAEPDEPELTADGLVRRVPGAGLSPRLRKGPQSARAAAAPADRDQMRSMLSRFQASQRAGRAVVNNVNRGDSAQ